MATIGEGLASFGSSVGGALKEKGKVQKNTKILQNLMTGLDGAILPEAQTRLKAVMASIDPSEDILPQVVAQLNYQKTLQELGKTKLTKFKQDPTTGDFVKLDKAVEVPEESPLPKWSPDDDLKAEREERTIKTSEAKVRSDMLNRATVLRKEFNAEQMYKNYNIIKVGYANMQKAYELSLKPDMESRVASDQILGVTIQKLLDPTSVVRESEYARTPEGIALMHRLEGFQAKLQKGGMGLTDADRKALVDGAKMLLDSSSTMVNSHISRYADLSVASDVDPELVIGKEMLGNIKGGTSNTSTEVSPETNAIKSRLLKAEEELKVKYPGEANRAMRKELLRTLYQQLKGPQGAQ